MTAALTAVVAGVAAPAAAQQGIVRFVNRTDPTCQGQSPCYATIQAAVDAAQAGDTIRLQAGTYPEQVTIQGKNNLPTATEADRIVIEADPALPPGSVLLTPPTTQCTQGHAIRLQQSKFVTLRGLTITGAGGQAISLMGGNNQNQAIHLERNRIFGNGSASCDGGITIARGNPDTLILNNLLYANGRTGSPPSTPTAALITSSGIRSPPINGTAFGSPAATKPSWSTTSSSPTAPPRAPPGAASAWTARPPPAPSPRASTSATTWSAATGWGRSTGRPWMPRTRTTSPLPAPRAPG